MDAVKALATDFLWIVAAMMPFHAFTNASYFTLRSGGKSGITFIFDSGFTWVIQIPVALALSRLTALPIVPLCTLCVSLILVKCALGYILLRRGDWLNNLTAS